LPELRCRSDCSGVEGGAARPRGPEVRERAGIARPGAGARHLRGESAALRLAVAPVGRPRSRRGRGSRLVRAPAHPLRRAGRRVLLAPGDIRGAVIDPALVGDSACCGLDDGEPNMVCVTCGTPVAVRIDDCGLRQAIWLDPRSTRVLENGPGPHPLLDWADLI